MIIGNIELLFPICFAVSMLEFQDSRSTLISYVIPSNMAVMSFVISFFIGEIEIILKNSNYNTQIFYPSTRLESARTS